MDYWRIFETYFKNQYQKYVYLVLQFNLSANVMRSLHNVFFNRNILKLFLVQRLKISKWEESSNGVFYTRKPHLHSVAFYTFNDDNLVIRLDDHHVFHFIGPKTYIPLVTFLIRQVLYRL